MIRAYESATRHPPGRLKGREFVVDSNKSVAVAFSGLSLVASRFRHAFQARPPLLSP